ncbi:hypothetical protein D3C84_979140 [compost metagenome]
MASLSIMRLTLTLAFSPAGASALITVLIAFSSAWPCLMPPGHCWLAADQLVELSIRMMTFG